VVSLVFFQLLQYTKEGAFADLIIQTIYKLAQTTKKEFISFLQDTPDHLLNLIHLHNVKQGDGNYEFEMAIFEPVWVDFTPWVTIKKNSEPLYKVNMDSLQKKCEFFVVILY